MCLYILLPYRDETISIQSLDVCNDFVQQHKLHQPQNVVILGIRFESYDRNGLHQSPPLDRPSDKSGLGQRSAMGQLYEFDPRECRNITSDLCDVDRVLCEP